MRKFISFLAFCLIASAASAAKDYYVWVDEDGVTNYSERNPQGVEAQHITSGQRFGERVEDPVRRRPGRRSTPEESEPEQAVAPSPGGGSAAGGGEVDPDALIEEERQAIAAKIAETKRENCEIGKRNLAQLQAYARIRVKGEDGQERILTPEERQAKIDEARQIVRDNCNG